MSEPRKVFIDTFEYIKQLVQMGQEPVYSITDYRNVKVLESELQGRPGINHVPNYEDGNPVWLEIERLLKSKAPLSLNEKLEPWLNQSHQPTKEPSLKEWIIVTLSGQEAEELMEKGLARKENVLESPRKQGMFDVRLFAKDDEDLNLAFTDYLQKQWLPWAYGEKPRRETMTIYEKFFAINQSMMAGEVEQPIELVWGIGHAVWKIRESNKVISHPLIEILVEVDLDSTSQTIRIRPRSVTQERPSIFTAPFEALELPGVKPLKEHFENQLDQMEAEEKTIHPADPTSFEGILRNAVSLLSLDAFYVPDVVNDTTNRTIPYAEESLAITDTWAIYARTRGVNYLVRDLERFQEKAKADNKLNSSVAIKFVKEPSSEKPSGGEWDLSGRATRLSSGALVGEISKDRDKEGTLYFPKPFNDAQRDIIERLDKSDGVVVQGPPGTGKTHTIANIICHYLATGRRVLVTAKSETALDVLKEQIPKEIQPLIISMVSNDREGMQQQKEAIETLQVKVVGLQGRERQIFREIELSEEEVFKLQHDIRIIDQRIKDFAVKQLEPLKLDWLEKDFENVGALAKWVVKNREYFKWFPDELGEGNEYTPLFDDDDIQSLIKAKQVVGQDIQYLNYNIPPVNNMLSTETIERIHYELITAKKIESRSVDLGIPSFQDESLETIQIAEGLVQEIRAIQSWVSKDEAGWLNPVLQSRVYPERPLPGWLEILDELRPELNLIARDRKKFLRKPVTFDANGAKERALLKSAVDRGKIGKNPLTMIQRLNKQAHAILQSVTILGKEPASKEDWEHIEEYLSFEEKCNELTVRWNAIATEAPISELVEENAAKFFEAICKQIEETDCIANKLTKTVWCGLDKIFPKASKFHHIEPKKDDLQAVVSAINQNLNVYRLSASKEMRREAIECITEYNCPESKELYEIFLKKIGSDEVSIEDIKEKWLEQITRLRYLHGLANSFETIRDVTEKIEASGATNWAAIICHEMFSEQEKEQLQSWKEVWRWARLNSILHLRDIQHQLFQLEESRLEKEIRIKQLFEDVVKQRTYLMLCQSMTDKAKAGLAKFMAAIMNVGRGTGVKAPIFMRAAQRAMLQCAEAIPCWIMPSWRVCEVLPTEFDFFDLVIVDEASQCDIRELPAISRGKKLLIVGDDRQVSPTAPFIEFKKFLQLKYNYLSEQPFGDLMLPGFSLYDLAGAVFPGNKTILNEHFRCVEPIIRFSFQFYSGITIHPLRIPKATERIDPPLVDILVEDGLKNGDLNNEEANVIVDEIEKLISDGRYERRSIGVISLIGRKQAAIIQTRLLERIGHEKYLKHQIICGDSATFQGREKDIVFLSMVASPGRSRALTMRQNQQRFNVAVSRARDRLYLVRSVELDELKPDDLKAQLIRHFQEPMPERHDVDKNLLDLCESDFERKVFIELTKRGYYVTPQIPVGDYRIDLVIEGDNDRRLAIELDGDKFHGPEKWLEDWTRQKVLERVGWKFWRCWASSYINDPEGCLNSLTQKLEEMGIKPQGNKAKRFAYTEHRCINTNDDDLENETIENLKADEVVGIGDKVILSLEDHLEGFVTVLITEDHTDHNNLIFAKDHNTALALIDKEINNEVEVDICGKHQKVCVVQIAKDGNVEADPLEATSDVAEILSRSKLVLNEKRDLEKISNPKVDNNHLIQATEQTSIKPKFSEQISQKQQVSEPTDKYPDPLNASRDLITKYLNLIVVEHGPIIVEHVYHIYLERAGIKRLGRQIKRILNQTMAAMLREGIILNADPKLKTKGMIDMVVKAPNQDDVVIRDFFIRPIEKIPKNELRALALIIKNNHPELHGEEFMRAIMEKYGLKRLTEKTKVILSEVIESLNN